MPLYIFIAWPHYKFQSNNLLLSVYTGPGDLHCHRVVLLYAYEGARYFSLYTSQMVEVDFFLGCKYSFCTGH